MKPVYSVAYWAGLNKDFPTFIEALSFYETAHTPRRIVNTERCDYDSCGLTEDERAAVELVDFPVDDEPREGFTDGDPGGCDPDRHHNEELRRLSE
jgi:hypothetical protein